jgi:hypothetical protein
MKTLKILMVVALLPLQFAAAKGPQNDDGVYTQMHAIDTYVDAMVRGKLQGFDAVLDPSAKFTILVGKNNLQSFDKKQMLSFMNVVKDTEMNCTVNTGIIQSTADMIVAKVDMKFPTFTRTNYVSIANTHSGWKILNVYSVFNQTHE